MSFIGLDLGTTFIKGAVLDLDACRIDHVQRLPFPSPLPGQPPLFWEYDPQAVLTTVDRLLDDLAGRAGPCEGLVMCSQMHGLVLADEQGHARASLTSWQDQRVLTPHPAGGTYFDMMAERIGAQGLRELGNETRPGLPIGVLFWLAEQHKLPAGLYPMSLPDFVLNRLCQSQPATDTTNGMAHGALNLKTLNWHTEVLDRLGLNHLRWPEVRPQGSVVGFAQIGRQRVPCYLPVGDFQCALAGALLRADELAINISTGSQVALLRPALQFGDYQTRPFFDGRFLIGFTHIPAGRALSLLVKLLSELAKSQGVALADPWPYILQQAEAAGPTDMRVDLAFFSSSCGDRGHILNMREPEMTVGHLFRAAFENMAANYLACAQRLSPEQEWRSIVLAGGLTHKSALLRALIRERFQVPCRLCPEQEDTLLGLLALGLAFSGRAASVEQAMTRLTAVFGSRAPGASHPAAH